MKIRLSSAAHSLVLAGLLALIGSQNALARSLPDFVDVVEQVKPMVVNISTTQKIKRNRPNGPHGRAPQMPEGTPFDDFFRRFFPDEEGMDEYNATSLGSGFIVSADGYILTNNHVIKEADEIVVRLSDRREFVAKVIGGDSRSDVALLKIEATDLPVAKIGDSNDLKVGEWVIAIGSPFDFEHTVTAGIVSALGRSLPSENYVPFIQTDVAINPGNSGGPLINMDGEVVGINAQIYSRTGGFMGLSFTIPMSLAMDVKDQLQTKGKVARGWLGVFIQDVTRDLAESFGMKQPQGALVSRVIEGSPAEKAGYAVGDVIVEFNGRNVIDSSSLPPMVGVTEIGKSVPVTVLRDGKRKKLMTTIAELPADDEIEVAKAEPKKKTVNRLGIAVQSLTKARRSELEIPKNGVEVLSVERGSAMTAGIRAGDVILKIDGKDVEDAEQFEGIVKDLPTGKNIAVLIHRGGGPTFVAIKIEK